MGAGGLLLLLRSSFSHHNHCRQHDPLYGGPSRSWVQALFWAATKVRLFNLPSNPMIENFYVLIIPILLMRKLRLRGRDLSKSPASEGWKRTPGPLSAEPHFPLTRVSFLLKLAVWKEKDMNNAEGLKAWPAEAKW